MDEDLIQKLETTSYANHYFSGNNDLITDVESLTDLVSMDDVSEHDVTLLSLLNSQVKTIPDLPIENSTSLSTSATDNPIQDAQHHATYSSRISSPLKLSYIPESEEESRVNINTHIDNSDNMTSVHDVINEVLNRSTVEGIGELKISEEPESIHGEDTFEQSERRKESLLDPINRLKELMNSQLPLSDNSSESLESNTESHSSQERLSAGHSVVNHDKYHMVSIPFDTDNNYVDISDSPVSKELSVKLRKRRAAPEALISTDIKQIMSRMQRTNIYAAKLDLLKQEATGLYEWINISIRREPPLILKNYKKGSYKTSSTLTNSAINKVYSNPALVKSTGSLSRTITEDTSFTNSSSTTRNSLDFAIQASSLKGRPMSPPLSPRTKTSNFLNISNLGRHNSVSKPNRPSIFMPPAVMNDPSANSPTSPKTATPIKPRQRRLSFQAVTSRFSSGSSTPTSSTFPTTIEENNIPFLSNPNSVVVDETALNKLCDILPLADREVLSKYLRATGGKNDLMAVDLYMKDHRGEI